MLPRVCSNWKSKRELLSTSEDSWATTKSVGMWSFLMSSVDATCELIGALGGSLDRGSYVVYDRRRSQYHLRGSCEVVTGEGEAGGRMVQTRMPMVVLDSLF